MKYCRNCKRVNIWKEGASTNIKKHLSLSLFPFFFRFWTVNKIPFKTIYLKFVILLYVEFFEWTLLSKAVKPKCITMLVIKRSFECGFTHSFLVNSFFSYFYLFNLISCYTIFRSRWFVEANVFLAYIIRNVNFKWKLFSFF